MARLVEGRLVDQPSPAPTRKVLAVIWVLVGAVSLLVALVAVRSFLIPDDPALDQLISAIGTAVPLLVAAVVAAYQTRERDAPSTPAT